jgi:hypothetical protein
VRARGLRVLICTVIVAVFFVASASVAFAGASVKWYTAGVYYDGTGRMIISGYFKNEGTVTVDRINWITLNVELMRNDGTLTPGDVAVEVCHGRVDARGDLVDPAVAPATFSTRLDDGASVFEAAVRLERGGGQYGFTVRVLPSHPDLTSLRPGLIAWADATAAHAAMP